MVTKLENKHGYYKYCCAASKMTLQNTEVTTRCYDKDETKYVLLTPEIKQQFLNDIESAGLHLSKNDHIGEIVSRINDRVNYKITYRRYGLIQNISNDTTTLKNKGLW